MANHRAFTPFQYLVASGAALGGFPGSRRVREAEGADLAVSASGDEYQIKLSSQEAHSWAHSNLHDHPNIEADFSSGDTITMSKEHTQQAVKLAKSAGLKVNGEITERRRGLAETKLRRKKVKEAEPEDEAREFLDQLYGDVESATQTLQQSLSQAAHAMGNDRSWRAVESEIKSVIQQLGRVGDKLAKM